MSPLFGGGRKEEPNGARSAAEREAARLERERRRAEREGRSLPAQPDAPPAAEPEPIEFEPPPVFHEPPVVRYESEPATHDPEPEPEPTAVWEREPVTVPAEPEAPAPLRRVGAPSVRDLPRVAGPRPAGPGAGRPVRRVPRRRRIARRIGALLFLVLAVAAGWFAYRLFQPGHDDGDARRPVRVTIPQGSAAGEIGRLLARRGVVDSSFFFGLRARLDGKRGELKAGTFTLKRNMSYAAALQALTANPKPPPVIHLTVPEGRSIGEEAPLIRRSGLKGSYLKAANRNPRTVKGLKGYGVPRGVRSLEGFLFPATYELKRRATARDLVAQQLAAFRRNFGALDLQPARRKNLTVYDLLIIASMIEREAQVPKDRALISAVIYNRLRRRMPLGIDATLRYHLNNWSRPLRQSELKADSAFNTRTRQGLPPTPIGSPGLASMKAALKPANVPYLFYVVKPCGNGAHAFSASDARFQKDVAAYNRKRDRLGGKDPSHC
jgi:peptidoglycan lytic transglycosylase G